MQAEDAKELIENGIETSKSQIWADLGCGSGTFTHALAQLLDQTSLIYAVDKKMQYFPTAGYSDIAAVRFVLSDFEKEDIPFSCLDGILMANSLHYVKDKKALIKKLEGLFSGNRRFLVVEYDFRRSGPWVPFPIDFQHVGDLFEELGYKSVTKLNERPSAFGVGNLYAALVV